MQLLKYRLNILLLLILTLISCKNEEQETVKEIIDNTPKEIVLISKNAPDSYKHYIKQDSIGQQTNEESGAYTLIKSPKFTYFDSQNNIKSWQPKINAIDTIVIPYYRDYIELSTRNAYTSIPSTFLVKNGDTVIIDYKHKLPVATITNREVNDIELNYNNYRLSELFNNKYTSHQKVFMGYFLSKEQSIKNTAIHFYEEALYDKKRELSFLDSLRNAQVISKDNYKYRKAILGGLIEHHKNNKIIEKWVNQNKLNSNAEHLETVYDLDLSKTDSLMNFTYFRGYLNTISKYNLGLIKANHTNSGGSYIDSKSRFDSILKDKRFNQTAKNYLLFDAYRGIAQNFSVKDKESYFKKLIKQTTNPSKITELQKTYGLDFSMSDQLILTDLKNDTITFSNVLKQNKGKWLYIDFWASWCKPCREVMPESIKLKQALEQENVTFIYLSLNDKKKAWKQAIIKDGISTDENYFIENGNTSKIIEDLGIETIPHYLIYNPKGELVNGFAKRPGQGAKAQLKTLMNEK